MANSISTLRRSAACCALATALLAASCATDAGDDVDCPDCDNVTELLVGNRCVPIAEVETCGPDGHAHGGSCHCFSGQQPTDIGGTEYCLQQGCAAGGKDYDALACAEADEAGDPVTAVESIDDVDSAHAHTDEPVTVTLPQGVESFVHFEAAETGEYGLYLDAAGVFDAALDDAGAALAGHDQGANPDCSVDFPELWHIEVDATGEVVIRFAAGSVAAVKIVIYHLEEDGHDH